MCIKEIEKSITKILEVEKIDEDKDFTAKKTITSAIRRIAPLGLATEMVWTANVRSIRHVIEMRSDPGAEEAKRNLVGCTGSEGYLLARGLDKDGRGNYRTVELEYSSRDVQRTIRVTE